MPENCVSIQFFIKTNIAHSVFKVSILICCISMFYLSVDSFLSILYSFSLILTMAIEISGQNWKTKMFDTKLLWLPPTADCPSNGITFHAYHSVDHMEMIRCVFGICHVDADWQLILLWFVYLLMKKFKRAKPSTHTNRTL